MQRRLAVGLTALVLALWAAVATAQQRVALVVGNSNYAHVPGLDNPTNDATDMAAALESLGFDVFSGHDLARDEMVEHLESFATVAASADVALFYFAGHAFQVAGRNYLVPSDLDPGQQRETLTQALPLDLVMGALESAPGLRIVILDACRDNPLGISHAAAGEGLAPVGTGSDFLVAYATRPGAVAYDGDGRNGTYTKALLNHIHTPGQDVSEMMIAVRRDVIAATGGQQVPWEKTSLTRQFHFDPGPRTTSPEAALFQVAARIGHPGLMSLYLERYPQGAHAEDAAEILMAQDSGGTRSRSLPSDLTMFETDEELWEVAQRTRLRELAAYYLDLFPDGAHSAEARRMLKTLPSKAELGPGQLCERLATHPRDASAMNPGVSFAQLKQNASLAIDACRAATRNFPEQPRFTALLARATIAAGRVDEAVALYKLAASRGDLRAMVSLGLLAESGTGVPKDPRRSVELYEEAADGGSADAAINLAVALFEGDVVPKDVPRAISLFQRASALGSPTATFNLGVLALKGVLGDATDALDYFRRAARAGEARAYRAAAVLLDEGRDVQRDPETAAVLLLRGAVEDRGEIVAGLAQGADVWNRDTIRAVQHRLRRVDLYRGAIDGLVGPQLVEAIRQWRSGGFDEAALTSQG